MDLERMMISEHIDSTLPIKKILPTNIC